MSGAHYTRVVVLLAAAFGLFFPSSINGIIMPWLDRVAIALNCAVFAALLLRTRLVADGVQLVAALAIPAWLILVTIWFPTARWSLGSVGMFLGLGLLLSINLRHVQAGRTEVVALLLVNAFAIGVGSAIALDVPAADRFIKYFYTAFYPGLIVSMIDWYNKPVLTLGTHSTAGLFFYLFFYLTLRSFEATQRRRWILVAVALILVGLRLRSTTSTVLMALAAAQLAMALWGRYRHYAAWAATAAPLAAIGILLWSWDSVVDLPQQAINVIVGNQSAGLIARYSESGMLGGNLRYLSENPFTPIGFTYGDDDLFYGDSGLVLLLLRGSLPLVIIVYVAFCRWLIVNLRDRRDLLVIGLVTLAFEIGYTPLLLFRYTSFLPFVIVYLNSCEPRITSPAGERTEIASDAG